jgi:hypothetical protein
MELMLHSVIRLNNVVKAITSQEALSETGGHGPGYIKRLGYIKRTCLSS